MRVIIEDKYLEQLAKTGKGIGKPKFNQEIERTFVRRISLLESLESTNELRAAKSLHFEKLSGDLAGKYSIRVNKAFRIVFRIETEGNNTRIEIICVEELNNHYS
jgi:proteic killer suppression protein